jgi:glycosyltransferase involved in cell wall biosynthesis
MDIAIRKESSFEEFLASLAGWISGEGGGVRFLLPSEPIPPVRDALIRCGAEIKVYPRWWKAHDDYGGKRDIGLAFHILWSEWDGFDVIDFHFCSEKTALIVGVASLLSGKGVRLFWHQHSMTRIQGARSLVCLAKKYFCVLSLLSRFIDRIVTVSESGRNDILSRNIPPNKVVTIYNGIDPMRFTRTERRVRRELGIGERTVVITNVGGPRREKGIPYLIEAATRVLGEVPDSCFLVAGQGPLEKELKEMAAARGISDRFRFLGLRQDIPDILAETDVFAFPSVREAMPISVLEAMASGLPIVATSVGGIPEMVTAGENGYLVEPGNVDGLASALLRLVKDGDLRVRMGARSRQLIIERKFTIDSSVEDHVALYAEGRRSGA